MPERSSYAPGTFSWAELATSDPDAAKAFYSALFQWDYVDRPVGQEMTYSMARRQHRDVAALFRSEQPPHWNCYVSVESADATAAKAEELGGTVSLPAFDVMDAGRMAVIRDTHGASLCLWQAGSHVGAGLVNTPGCLTWNDLVTPDPQESARFYEGLFGWETEEVTGAGGYRVIRNDGRTNGGMMPLDPQSMGPGAPPSWLPYFGHEDVSRVAGEVQAMRGRLFSGPLRMPQGSIAVLGDPQGAVFAVWTGAYDD